MISIKYSLYNFPNIKLLQFWLLVIFFSMQACGNNSSRSNHSPATFTTIPTKEFTHKKVKNQFSIISWNIQKLGNNEPTSRLESIKDIVKTFDLIAIQEVNRKSGAPAIAKLHDMLNRTGAKWDYYISDPTPDPKSKSERYAFIWKTKSAKLIGKIGLWRTFEDEIYREPFLARFLVQDKKLLIANYHSRKYYDHPEEEVKYLQFLKEDFPNDDIIIAGDFNLETSHEVFQSFKEIGFDAVLTTEKTTLKRKCSLRDKYLSRSIDNIWYNSKDTPILGSGVIDFVKSCDQLMEARKISDHLPVGISFVF